MEEFLIVQMGPNREKHHIWTLVIKAFVSCTWKNQFQSLGK